MLLTRKLHGHGELYWWLILLTLATTLMSFLAREARGDRWGPGRLKPVAGRVWDDPQTVASRTAMGESAHACVHYAGSGGRVMG